MKRIHLFVPAICCVSTVFSVSANNLDTDYLNDSRNIESAITRCDTAAFIRMALSELKACDGVDAAVLDTYADAIMQTRRNAVSAGEPDTAGRAVWTLSLSTTGYGQVGDLLKENAAVVPDTVRISGPIGNADFGSLYEYLQSSHVAVLDLSGTTVEDNQIPDKAFFRPGQTKVPMMDRIILPEGIEAICAGAFCNTSLKEVNIPSTVRRIGSDAFSFSYRLDCEIVIPEGVEEISRFTFYDCFRLSHAPVLPSTLKTIESFAFGHTAISTLSLPEGMRGIGAYGLSQTDLKAIHLPDACVSLGENALSYNIWLTDVTLPDNVEEIPESLLSGSNELRKVNIPAGCRVIGRMAFDRCHLEQLELPEGVEELGEEAFKQNCLKTVSLPSTVTGIGSGCFLSNSTLQTVCCRALVPPVFSDAPNAVAAFDSGDATLYVPVGTADIYRSRPQWQDFKEIIETDSFPSVKVTEISAGESVCNPDMFDLTGKRMSEPNSNGIYIQNGKKHIAPVR